MQQKNILSVGQVTNNTSGILLAKGRLVGKVKTEVKGDSLLVLHHGSLHEPTDEPDGECQVRASVHQVAQTADETSVMSGVDLRRAVPTKPQSFLHWSMGRTAASHVWRRVMPLASRCTSTLRQKLRRLRSLMSKIFIICALNASTFCSSTPVMMRSST